MPFQALLFCPDDKTARTLTQVLGELEFTVEPCAEPFGAVKKLMSQHFDALVVDCDNEQNATLLFKSARNSTSNQASLAVAIVEGQAGVAKAFRIGANLVLTKPINVEQSKGTLRVARGLLRKGDPGKPASSASSAAPASPAPATPVPAATKPAAAKPAPGRAVPPRPGARVAPASAARPVTPPVVPAAKSPADVAAAMAAESSGLAPENETPEIKAQAPAIASSHIAPTAAPHSVAAAKPSFDLKSESPATSFGSTAAAAAPARETHPVDAQPKQDAPAAPPIEAHIAEPLPSQSAPAAAPSFTFGGANEPEVSSGGSKKILLGVAAIVVVAASVYAGWSHISGQSNQSASQTNASAPVSQPAKPSTPSSKLAATASVPSSQPSPESSAPAASSAATDSGDHSSASDASAPADITLSTKPSASTSSKLSASAKKTPATPDPASEAASSVPLVVKSGSTQPKSASTDAPAPSLIGIAAAGSTQALPNLGNSASAPKPVLEKLTVSQGVSQGLLVKKIPPAYPKTALAMHIEGTVELTATVSKSGDITSVKLLKGDATLARAAMDAVKEWKYKPYLLNGEPVEIQTQVTVSFKLPN
jgi:periplasmic protein TonB